MKIDIHNYPKRLKGAVRRLEAANISVRNKQLILDFRDFCSLEGMSLARIIRYLAILRDFGFDPLPVLRELKRVLKPNGQIYVFCATKQIPLYISIFEKDWFFRNLLVWNKTNPPPRISKTNFVFANDYIVYAVNEKVKCNTYPFNFKKHSEMHNTIITSALQGKERLKDQDGRALHPTQKPLSILKKLIEISSDPGDVVLDPFMGVGSTAVAAKELGELMQLLTLARKFLKNYKFHQIVERFIYISRLIWNIK